VQYLGLLEQKDISEELFLLKPLAASLDIKEEILLHGKRDCRAH